MRGIQSGHAALRIIQEAINERWLKETTLESREEKALYELLFVPLSLGEASSIAIAKSRGLLFASDDKAARREASLLGVKLTGTVGILKKADLILECIVEHGLHSPIRTLKDID